jgi:hypothetical protein
MLKGRDILNICGEVNTHSHYTEPVRARFNQTIFGATFYTSALLYLMRGNAYAEMFWTGTEDKGGYGMMNKRGELWPVFYAKKLCAEYIRHGDWISFPIEDHGDSALDVVTARGDDGRRSALLVHLKDKAATYSISELADSGADYQGFLKIDQGTGNCIVESACKKTVSFEGYGVAVVTTDEPKVKKPE